MRISDLSTFDSKPILWSQLDELLSNKNVTMLGNQANIPSGLVVLDDKGKIPENANIQHIFYVDNDFPISGLIKNSLYVNSAGEARATNDNAEYINISLQVVTDFSTVSDETVATTKAIKDYVDTTVTEVATGSSGVLSSYATKEYVDNAVASASGDQHIFYVDALPSIEDAIENSLYVVKGTKEAQIFDGTEYAPISLETLTDFSTVSNDTLATTQAISAFVDEKLSNIDIPDPDLSAYQPVSGMSDYALKTDIPDVPEEVIYVDEFPTSGLLDTIYVNKNGQSKIWNGTEFVSMSYEVVDSISTETSQSGVVVPSVQAVIDYVSAYTPTLPDNITTQGNEFNSGNQLVQLVDGKIPESLYNGDTQHIFYVSEFPVSGVENSLYVKQDTKETKIYTGSEYISISLEVIKDLTAATSGTIATSKSIVDYLSAYYADKAYVTEAVTNAMLSGEVDLTPYAKTEWVNTELAKKANLTDIKDHIIKVESLPEVSAALANSIYILGNSSASFFDGTEFIPLSLEAVTDFSNTNHSTIPTTQAVSSFVDTKISEINIPSTDLSNYYNKTESDEKFALKENTVSYTFTTENSLNTIPITNGQAVICEDSEKLYIDKTDTRISIGDLIIVEASADLPETPLNKLYFVKETDKLYIYSNNTWVSINPNQFIDPNRLLPSTAENGNLLQYYIETGDLVTPTGLNKTSQQDGEDWTITYENFADKQVGSYWYAIFDGDTQYNSTGKRTAFNLPAVIQWKSNKEKKILNKLRIYPTRTETSGEYIPYYPPATFKLSGSNDGQVWTTLLDVYQYRWPGDNEYKFTYSNIYHDWFFENNTGYLYYKLDITEVSSVGVIHNNSSGSIDELQGYGEARGWRLISVDDIKSDIALDLSNYQQENNISIASTNGSISLSGTDFVINGNTSNTSGGLAIVEESGKLPSSIIPDVDLSNYYNKTESDEKFALKDDINSKLALSVVEDFPTSGINNTLYVNNENHAQIYANDQWKDIAVEVVENFETVNQTTVPTTQAVKDYIDANAGSGGISSITVGSGLTGNGTSESPLKLDLSNYSQDGNISITASGDAYLTGINFNVTAENINLNSHAKNTAGGFAIVEDSGKLPTSIIPESTVDLSNYHGGFKVITDDSEGPILIQGSPITLLGYELTLQSTLGNMILNAAGNNIDIDARVCDIYGTYIKLSTSQNSLTFNGAELNTPGGLVRLDENGKISATLVTDTFNNPEQKTEVTTNSIAFKKNISIYKIEVANATTFTFDFSQLDENNCYTFELWVSMSTPVTLTFPSNVAWLNDEVPDMSEASTYCIVVRKLPSTMGTSTITSPKALLNLAYQYPLVLG